jgi:GTP-binding protein HflX
MGGPGETQIEADRRMLQDRIIKLERELEQVVRTRQLHRAKRRKVPHPIVALVGYTNAGKSTLFNRITGAGVLAEDMLFATLDPTLRRMKLPHGRTVILSDTVGFISDLPTHLVAAFRATLEEVLEADLVLHVRDMADDDNQAQSADVLRILKDLGIDEAEGEKRIIEVWNKIDRLEPEFHEAMVQKAEGNPNVVAVVCRHRRGRRYADGRDQPQAVRRVDGGDGDAAGRQAGAAPLALRSRDHRQPRGQ